MPKKSLTEAQIIKALRTTSSINKAAKKLGVSRVMMYLYRDKYAGVKSFFDNPVREADLITENNPTGPSVTGSSDIVDINYILREKQRLYESIPYIEDVMDQLRIEVNNAIKEVVEEIKQDKIKKARKNQEGSGDINVYINDPDKIIASVEKVINSELQAYVRVRSEKRSSMDSLEKFLKVFGDEISKETERVQKMTESELLKEAKELSVVIEQNIKERIAAFNVS